MEYISTKQAAEKWDVSERFVQRRCTEGRIEGAAKFGGSWMIPCEAQKPEDMRKTKDKGAYKKAVSVYKDSAEHKAMPLLNSTFEPGCAMEFIEGIRDEDTKNIALAEYYYLTGKHKKSSDIAEKYLENDVIELRGSALYLYTFANLSCDRIGHTKKALRIIKKLYDGSAEGSSDIERSIAVCLFNSVCTQLHTNRAEDLTESQRYVYALPKGIRLFVLFNQAHYAFIKHHYGVAVGIAETGLVLDDVKYTIPSIYLHTVCAMSYIHLGYVEMARKHLLAAWEYAKADGFIEPLGELQGLLCGMLESVFKRAEPEEYRKMIKIAKKYSAGWIKIHNEITGDKIPYDLTPTEYVACMLVARGWRTKEIAEHLAVTKNAVQKYVSEAMSKMGISKRSDIKKVMP